MEKLRIVDSLRTLNKNRKIRTATAIFVAGAALVGTAQTEGKEPYVYTQTSQENFQDLILEKRELDESNLTLTIPSTPPTPIPIPPHAIIPTPSPSEKPLSEKEKKIEKIKKEAKEIYDFAKASGEFSENLLEDLRFSLPFQLAAGKKYGVDWVVSFVMEQRESGGSSPKSKAFAPPNANSRVQGAYQIDIGWSKDFRDVAFEGLEYTKVFPERHKGDNRDTATVTRMLYRNIKKQMNKGRSYEDALFKAVLSFVGQDKPNQRDPGHDDEVNIRVDMILRYDKIFGHLAGNKIH